MRRTEYAKDYEPQDASGLSVGIVVSRWNSDITEGLLEGAREILRAWKVREKNVTIVRVAGSFEVPFGCLKLLKKKKRPDAVIALGCLIKGETKHDEYIASAVALGIMRLSLDHATPIGFGIVTANDLKQAQARSRGVSNKGKEAAVAALEAALG